MRTLVLFLLTLTSFNAYTKDPLPYQNPNLTAEQRVEDLIGRMTLREKAGQMCQFVGIEHIIENEGNLTREELKKSNAKSFYPNLHSSHIPGVIKKGEVGSFLHVVTPQEANSLQALAAETRLQIPLIIGIDAVHGNGMVSGATIYPSPLSMASAWDLKRVKTSSMQTALEMRANGAHWTFAPNVDIARDPRWGRVGETFGEDPYLVGEMGKAMIEGFQQGDFKGYKKVIANAKHFVAGGSPSNGINGTPMDVSERTLREIYFPPFKKAVDTGVFSFMGSHNEVNGIPAHGSHFLLTEVLRNEWGFTGFVVSDWMDVERLATLHKVAKNHEEAVYQSVRAGIDMNMHGPNFIEPLIKLIKNGRISMERLHDAIRPILLAKFRLGLFENPYVDLNDSKRVNNKKAHQKIALELARESIVLLTNNKKTLPLKGNEKIFITGANANNQSILGDWVLKQPEENITTILEGLENVIKKENLDFYDVGKRVGTITDQNIIEAGLRAKTADVAIIVVGENPLRYDWEGRTSGEDVARSKINLFGRQLELIQSVHQSGTPVVVVFVNSRPLAEPWVVKHAAAFIEAWEPGAKGGQALAEILLGKVNPSGKLPITIPYSAGHINSYYNKKPSQKHSNKYRDSPTNDLFAFGYGLSYTQFQYSKIKLSKNTITADESISASILVKNTGNVDGDEIIQLYIRDNVSQITRPVKELKSFKRIHLKAGKSKKVSFTLGPEQLSYYNMKMESIVEPGQFTIMIGSSSRDEDLSNITLNVIHQ